MKNNKITLTWAAVLFMALSVACNNQPKHEDSKEAAEDKNEAVMEDRKDEKDAQFLVNAAEINLKEISLGQLAQSKSSMKDVQDLGKMMETEHSQTMSDLKALADKKSITIPTTMTEDAQKDYDKMNEKTGHDFDKDYCEAMVKGHKDAIDMFEKASMDAKDADIRAWAASVLPALHKHLEHATACEEKCKKMK